MGLEFYIKHILDALTDKCSSVTFDLYLDRYGCIPNRHKDAVQHITFTIQLLPKHSKNSKGKE